MKLTSNLAHGLVTMTLAGPLVILHQCLMVYKTQASCHGYKN